MLRIIIYELMANLIKLIEKSK